MSDDSKQDAKQDDKQVDSLHEKVEDLTKRLSESETMNKAKDQQLEKARQYVANMLEQANAEPEGESPVEFKEKFEEDPEKAIADMFNARMAPLVNDYLQTQAISSRELAVSKLNQRPEGDRWDDYAEEIDAFVASLPPDAKVRPDAYERAFDIVRSRHVDDIVSKRMASKLEAEKQSQVEHASASATPQPMPEALTAEEQKAAKAFGMTEDEYRKSRNEHIESGGVWQGNRL